MSSSIISAKGSVNREVTCESCSNTYNYTLEREVVGMFHGYARTRAEADEKAAREAAIKLKRLLNTDIDIVPCPKCGAITREMQAKQRKDAEELPGSMAIAGLVVIGVGLLFFGILWKLDTYGGSALAPRLIAVLYWILGNWAKWAILATSLLLGMLLWMIAVFSWINNILANRSRTNASLNSGDLPERKSY